MLGIYCFRNKINGKCYIGQSVDVEKRYSEHRRNHLNPNYCNYNSKFYRALRKYGFENFDYTILVNCNKKDLNDLEKFFIAKYDSFQNGYNSTIGGEDNPSNYKEIVEKRTQKIKSSPEILEKLSHQGSDNGNAKLTELDVINIRKAYLEGKTFGETWPQYASKISRSGFQQVWTGKTWTDVMMEVYDARPVRNSGGSKLTEQDVRNIRIRYEKYGESKETIYYDYKDRIGMPGLKKILSYLTWKNVII